MIFRGNCLDVLKTMEPNSFHCCVTSPPYWGLRSYLPDGHKDKRLELGAEKTPDEYVANMVEVFREVRRVLREDATLWCNLGDTYAGYHGNSKVADADAPSNKPGYVENMRSTTVGVSGLKPKDLVGIPWRVAFALQADGWWLRQDICWSKPNPMPESVRDRCTKSHEYIFLLSKSAKYYFDQEAIAEPVTQSTLDRLGQKTLQDQAGSTRVPGKTNGTMKASPPRFGGDKYGDNDATEHRTKSGNEYKTAGYRNKRSVWTVATQPCKEAHFATFPPKLIEPCILAGCPVGGTVLDPFFGAGTTGLVAVQNARKYVGIELNPEYIAIAERRIERTQPGLPLLFEK